MDKINVIYCSSLCSEETYKKLYENSLVKPGQQVQKYHRTLVKGLIRTGVVDIVAISKLQVQRTNTRKLFVNLKNEMWQGIKIKYLPTVNIPFINNIFQTINAFFCTFFTKTKNSVVILDVLNPSMNAGVFAACKIKRIKVIGIVTDLPDMLTKNPKAKFSVLCNKQIKKCDGYVLLTEQMRAVVDPENMKPYCVIEGQIDDDVNIIETDVEKNPKKICMYTGGIEKEYGLEYLVKGFIKAGIQDAELHIYGNGHYVEDLKQIVAENSTIKYLGVKLNTEIVELQKQATLLINPRPTVEEFVKYSFPSKNMEYMASGTPMLTTVLPGMPKEYYPYVYLLEEENEAGIVKSLQNILGLSNEELAEKGKNAKLFVIENKKASKQVLKIIDLVSKLT